MKSANIRSWLRRLRHRRGGADAVVSAGGPEHRAGDGAATTRLRSAGLGDVDALVDLIAGVQMLHVENEPSIFIRAFSRGAARKHFEDIIDVSSSKILIAERDRRPAGYILYKIKTFSPDLFLYRRKLLYVDHIAVDSGMRRAGVGTLLLRAVEAEARAKGVAEIALDTWSFNEDAQRFFRAVGYEPERIFMRKKVS